MKFFKYTAREIKKKIVGSRHKLIYILQYASFFQKVVTCSLLNVFEVEFLININVLQIRKIQKITSIVGALLPINHS